MCVCIAQVKSDSQAKVLCMTTIGILKLRAGQMDEVQVRSEVIEGFRVVPVFLLNTVQKTHPLLMKPSVP